MATAPITYLGTDGNDKVKGTSSSDYLAGARGADNLSGGAGNDLLVGGNFVSEWVFENGHWVFKGVRPGWPAGRGRLAGQRHP